ncbi:MAG: trypsin-like peptidase domain-containing protein [Roseobacter sp.]
MLRLVFCFLAAFFTATLQAHAQQDQEVVWVQIEARPNLADALERADEFARTLEDVHGFALGGGWFAIALGPYRASDAAQVLDVFRADGLIPRDSYIARSQAYGSQFYPQRQSLLQRVPQQATTEPDSPAAPEDTSLPAQEEVTPSQVSSTLARLEAAVLQDTETERDARTTEQLLTADEKRGLQQALAWAGFYTSTIDGAFGRGTRASISAWQRANDLPQTGVMTTAQRALLFGQYNEVLEGLGLAAYSDETTGLSVNLPLGVVGFERYDPPFAHFTAQDGSTAQVLLISQPGDRATLASLYDVMQTLEIVPLQGPRSLDNSSFTLVGRNARIVSEARVTLADGALKGFMLVWPADDETRRTRLLDEMQRSLVRLDGVLDPALGSGQIQQLDFVSGLAVRKPKLARSGFFVDGQGAVLTTADAVQNCTRILLDDTHEAQLSKLDRERGLAILTPQDKLSPPAFAAFSDVPPRLQSDIAVAGYSYEGILGAPTLTFGKLADLQGLRGEQDLNRLSLASLPGDAGGPVFDTSGNVVGMLLPRATSDRRLPDDVSFALAGQTIAAAARDAGLSLSAGDTSTPLPPEDITRRGIGMTVLVSCWE